jgi:hypothetical protein
VHWKKDKKSSEVKAVTGQATDSTAEEAEQVYANRTTPAAPRARGVGG